MINKIISEEYADLIIDSNALDRELDPEDVTYINFRHSILHLPIIGINKCSIGVDTYKSFPSCFTLESLISLEESGVTAIQNNPVFALNGNGVLIGMIDTGIDYQHEAFINNGKTKITSIWDQTIEDVESKSLNVKYGTVYNREDINEALSAQNPLEIVPTTDDIGHGTMISGIIAGNESIANGFRGVVTEAELVVVKLKQAKKITREIFAIPENAICYQETDILLGVNYVIDRARELGRPLAICIAVGSSQGAHDGRSALSGYLSYVTDSPGVVVVISGGNQGASRRHYFGEITSGQNFNEFELKVGANEEGFSLEIWQSSPHLLTIEATSPSGDTIESIFPERGVCRRISLIFERTIVYINNIITESETGDQLILVRFEYPTEGIWKFKMTNIDGLASSFNAWLPSGNLISNETYFLNSNPNITLTSPANSFYPITITAYNNLNDSIWLEASRGYTRLDIVKPDLAAPGVNLVCPMLNNQYGTATGTGAAAAHATGIAAMLLESNIVKGSNPFIRGTTIRQILIRGAQREKDLIYPNNIWGYGKINILGTFQVIR